MTTPTSASIIAASRDADLLQRAVALGATVGLTEADIRSRAHELAAAPVGEGDSTVASVFEYAQATYEPTPRPGENPAAVTDAHLLHALQALNPPPAE